MYNPVSNKTDFNRMEEEVLAFWKEHDTFAKSLEQTKARDAVVFYDGPPFATGLPHYGHLLAGTMRYIGLSWARRVERGEEPIIDPARIADVLTRTIATLIRLEA